jgi:hypothetical protein
MEPLAGLTRLEELDLNYLPITGEGLEHLAALPALRRLSLTTCQKLKPSHLTALARFPALEALHVSGPTLPATAIKHLGRLSGLRILDLYGAYIKPADLGPLSDLSRLEWLRLPANADGSALRPLSGLTDLRSLSLQWATLEKADLVLLASLPNLRHLSLRECRIAADALGSRKSSRSICSARGSRIRT